MKKSDFYFDLPEELIAQSPAQQRDHSRLLVVHRKDHSLEHRRFYDIVEYLHPGDALVINETRVIPALGVTVVDSGACGDVTTRQSGPRSSSSRAAFP